MREKLSRRLEHLEKTHVAAMRAKAADSQGNGPTAAEIIRERLRLSGYVQTGNESLAETTARAFGMNSQELRHLMAGPVEAFNVKLQALSWEPAE
jgi:hypothetical protein